MNNSPNVLACPIAKKHVKENINSFGDISQTFATWRAGEKTAERLPILFQIRKVGFRLFGSHVIGKAGITLTDKRIHANIDLIQFILRVGFENAIQRLNRTLVSGMVNIIRYLKVFMQIQTRLFSLNDAAVGDGNFLIGNSLYQ